MGMELFELAAKVALDKGDFDKGVQEADDSGKALADNLSKYFEKAKKVIAGLFTVAAVKKAATAVWDLAKTTSAAGDRIDKVSQSIGFSRKKFQEWDYILSQNGASIDDLGLAMKTLDQAIVGNSAEASAALSKLGLSAAHLASLSPEEQFEKVVAALQKMPDGADKSRIALQLFGKNAQSLMPLLNSSAESVEELRQRAHDLGLIMSDEDVDASVAFGDALDDLNKVWSAVQMKFGAKILPMLTKGLVNVANLFGKLGNAVEDALVTGNWSGVFDVIKNAIHWPTWPEVRDAAIRAWEGIKEGALSLAGLVFGKKEDGTVDWPDWGTVVDAATAAWNLIKGEALNLAGLVFGKKEDGSVAWPEWSDVEAAANAVWAEIKKGAENLAGLVFGRKEDGTVAWPEWDDIVEGAVSLWNDIVSFVANIATEGGKLIFGVNEDGEVNWPTLESLIAGATDLWNNVLSFVANIGTNVGKLIFGVNDDGEVNWPSLDSLIGGAVNLWGDLISFVANIGKEVGKLVFGANEDGEVNWPTLESLIAGAEDLWRNVLSFVANIGTNVGKLIFGVNDQGEVNWPSFESVITGASDLWNSIITYVANIGTNVGKLIFGANDSGQVNWPDFNTLAQGAVDLWNSLVLFVANIGTNVAKLIFGANDNGEVNWPDLSVLETKASELWNALVEYVAALPGTVSNFGDEIYKAMMGDAAEAIEAGTGWSKIGEAIVDKIEEGLKFGKGLLLRMVFGDDAEGKTFYDIGQAWAEDGNISDFVDGIFAALGTEGAEGQTKGEQLLSKIFGDVGELLRGFFENTNPDDVLFQWNFGQRLGEKLREEIAEAFSEGNIFGDIGAELLKFFQAVENFINDIRRFFGWDVPEFKETFDFSNGLDFGQFGEEGLEELNEYINAYNTLVSLKEKLKEDPNNSELKNAASQAQKAVGDALAALNKKNPRLLDYFTQYLAQNGVKDLEDMMPTLMLDGQFDPSVPSTLQGALDEYHLEVPVSATIVSLDTSALTGFSYGSSSGGNFGGSSGGGPPIVRNGNAFFMNAKGDSYVPYDNYPAMLHRGEAVLTADQARNWRNGRPDGIDADMLYNAVAEAVAAAVGSIQVNMDGAAVGNMVTNQVSRNMYRKQAGRRYGVG